MQYRFLIFLFCLSFFTSRAQDPDRIKNFENRINEAGNDDEKISALCELAEYYSVFRKESMADSVLQKALFIAEISTDKNLIFKILFNNNLNNLKAWISKASYERLNKFMESGLQYAQELNRVDYIALSYIQRAGVFRKRGQFDEALQQATQAFTALSNTKADSIICILYDELGDIYKSKGEAVTAYKNYNSAFEIAYRNKNIPLQSEVYHRFFELYWSLKEVETAKKYLFQSLQVNIK
jgi:tetratricopeptide (TPR) repeat protein